MALIHPQTCECLHSGLDLFSVPPTQTAVEEGQFIEMFPLAALAHGAPIEFMISGTTEEYVDLSNTFIHVTAKVTKADGSRLQPNEEVGPVNLYLHSLFSQVDISLNDTVITPSENTYPYKAYIETQLNRGFESKTGYLAASCYYKDTAGKMDENQGNDNEGLTKRTALAAQSDEIDMMGRIHADIFSQERYLLNGVDVKIKLSPSKDAFNLIAHDAAAGYRSVITHASLLVRKAKLNATVSLAHEKTLEKTNAKYPLKRGVIKTFAIARGMISHTQDNMFLSQTPNRLVIGLVDSTAFNGTYTSNPYNFKHAGLTHLSLSVDGRNVTGKPLRLDFTRNKFIRAFFESKLALGLVHKDADNYISYDDFREGYALYGFDLSPSLVDGDQFEMVKNGALCLELTFSRALETPLQCLVYAELDSVIEIDRSRQILVDFGV